MFLRDCNWVGGEGVCSLPGNKRKASRNSRPISITGRRQLELFGINYKQQRNFYGSGKQCMLTSAKSRPSKRELSNGPTEIQRASN
jgi:hypothetical protein